MSLFGILSAFMFAYCIYTAYGNRLRSPDNSP
jgi:uncharacterized membrane protein required for colicin V production